MYRRFIISAAVLAALFASRDLRADFIPISQPNASYLSATTLLSFNEADFTLVGSLSGGGITLSYDNLLDERTVPGTWSTWGTSPAVESASPRIGYTEGLSTLTITLSRAATIFGFEVGPDNSFPEETTADFYSGNKLVGTIDLSPSGDTGALLFAALTNTNPFTSVVITNLEGDDFAIAQQRFALAAVSAPEPKALALLTGCIGASLVFLARVQSRRQLLADQRNRKAC